MGWTRQRNGWVPNRWGGQKASSLVISAIPLLLKYGQDLPFAGWYTANAAHAGTRPFDGTFLYLTGGSNGVFLPGASLVLGDVQAEMAGFHAAPLGNLTHNFPVIRITEDPTTIDWWNDTHWTTICANAATFVQGVMGARVAGIVIDNEHYHASGEDLFDWVNGAGIDPTHTLPQSQTKAFQRGAQLMTAIKAVWADVPIMMLHGPYISDPDTGGTEWTAHPFWNDVSSFNELSGPFTQGMMSVHDEVYDGGEVYAIRSEFDVTNVRDWQQTTSPGEGYAQGVGDFNEFDGFNVQQAVNIEDQIGWAFDTRLNGKTYKIVWYYTEKHDWWEGGWGSHIDIDDPAEASYKNAITRAYTNKDSKTLFAEHFIASNGSPWTGWDTGTSAGGTIDVQDEEGRMLCGSLGAYADFVRAVAPDQGTSNFKVRAELIIGTQEEKYPGLSWRSDGTWSVASRSVPANGYSVEIFVDGDPTGTWNVEKSVASARTNVSGFQVYNFVAGDRIYLEVIVSGNDHEVRIWKNAEKRPETASYSFTDAVHNTLTRQGLSINGGNGTTDSIRWDNFIVYSL